MSPEVDHGPTIARRAPELLGVFNRAGVLAAADVHVATRLADLGGESDDAVVTGTALVVRGLRLGHVCVDLDEVAVRVAADADPDADLSGLPWPAPTDWVSRLASSPLVAVGDGALEERPLRLVGRRLYLDRPWRQERLVAAELLARSARPLTTLDGDVLDDGLARLWPGGSTEDDDQRVAAAVAVEQALTVVAGGPGTGKTTTVARILALLFEQAAAAGRPAPRVALAAPTGKAAARLEEAVHDQATHLLVDDEVRRRLMAVQATTIHRLLGRRPDSESRFRHDHSHRLAHDTVIIDETSMVSLALMASLVDALRADARLVLVGDPEQLSSVEAGAVLGDLVGPREGPADLVGPREGPGAGAGVGPGGPAVGVGGAVGPAVVRLSRGHRFAGRLADLAKAVRLGDADAVIDLVHQRDPALSLVELGEGPGALGSALATVRADLVDAHRVVVDAARSGDARAALNALSSMRVLCAHRSGPSGVTVCNEWVEARLRAGIAGFATEGPWYPGRPLLVTTNDYELQLFNGDTGVVATGPDGRVGAVFARRSEPVWIAPSRLASVETVFAMTVHKAQGSQFDEVIAVLPPPASPVLTRQLLYTAVTRARRRVVLVTSEASLRAAVGRPVARATGLADRLWPPAAPDPPTSQPLAT